MNSVKNCEICNSSSCEWSLPEDYNPTMSPATLDKKDPATRKVAFENLERFRSNCETILDNEIFVVKDGKLKGYSKWNIPMRVYLAFESVLFPKDEKERQKAVNNEIKETFECILDINISKTSSGNLSGLQNTIFDCKSGLSRNGSYTALAKKVTSRFSKKQFPELHTLSNRILHERKACIKVPHYTKNGESLVGRVQVPNIKANVRGTPYEQITRWW